MVNIDKIREKIRETLKKYPLPKKIYNYVAQQSDIPKEVTTKALLSEICRKCGDKVYHPSQEINRTLWGTGDCEKGIMFVLQNPGVSKVLKHEKFRGITRTGVSCAGGGAILRWVTNLAGYDFDRDIYTTNCVKCCTSNNKKPCREIQNKCYPFLKQEIKEINPDKILTFGNPAGKNVNKAVKELNKNNIQVRNFSHYSYAVNKEQIMKNTKGKDFTDWVIEIISFLTY